MPSLLRPVPALRNLADEIAATIVDEAQRRDGGRKYDLACARSSGWQGEGCEVLMRFARLPDARAELLHQLHRGFSCAPRGGEEMRLNLGHVSRLQATAVRQQESNRRPCVSWDPSGSLLAHHPTNLRPLETIQQT